MTNNNTQNLQPAARQRGHGMRNRFGQQLDVALAGGRGISGGGDSALMSFRARIEWPIDWEKSPQRQVWDGALVELSPNEILITKQQFLRRPQRFVVPVRAVGSVILGVAGPGGMQSKTWRVRLLLKKTVLTIGGSQCLDFYADRDTCSRFRNNLENLMPAPSKARSKAKRF